MNPDSQNPGSAAAGAACLPYLLIWCALLAAPQPLRADNPPPFAFSIESSSVPGGFNGLSGIAVDSSRNIYALDGGSNRVVKFNSNGVYSAQWGSSRSCNWQSSMP